MEHKEYIDKLKTELLHAATNLINDDIHFVEGIRIIKDRLDILELDDDEVNLTRGIDSETNDIPIGDTRKRWNKEALRKVDDEIIDYIVQEKAQVIKVCEKIVKQLSNP